MGPNKNLLYDLSSTKYVNDSQTKLRYPYAPEFDCLPTTSEYPNVGEFTWPGAAHGKTVDVACAHGGLATRKCGTHSWEQADVSGCNTATTERIDSLIEQLQGSV